MRVATGGGGRVAGKVCTVEAGKQRSWEEEARLDEVLDHFKTFLRSVWVRCSIAAYLQLTTPILRLPDFISSFFFFWYSFSEELAATTGFQACARPPRKLIGLTGEPPVDRFRGPGRRSLGVRKSEAKMTTI